MVSLRVKQPYRISWDILAGNSDLVLFANSAASIAAVFFWILSRKVNTIWLIWVLSESTSPLVSTVMNRLGSSSIAAAEIYLRCEIADYGVDRHRKVVRHVTIESNRRTERYLHNHFPDNDANFGVTTQFTLSSNFPCDCLHLRGECGELVNHTIDGVDQIQHLSEDEMVLDGPNLPFEEDICGMLEFGLYNFEEVSTGGYG